MDTYEIFLLFHIVGAISWVGADTYLFMSSRRVLARYESAEVKGFMSDISYLGPRFFIPVSLITVVFGVLTAIEGDLDFGEPWISAGLGMFVLSFILGSGFLKPRADKLDAMGDNADVNDPEYRKLVDQMLLISRVELVFLWAIVVLMVIKPG